MKQKVKGRVKSVKYAGKGLFLLLRTEDAIITQAIISLIFIGLGVYFGINRWEWIVQISMMGFVLATESLNTAVEKICDFIHPDYNEKIGLIKDIAAGAVSFAALTSVVVAIFLYYPYIFG